VIRFLAYVGGVTAAAWTAALVGLGIGAGLYAAAARLTEWRRCRKVRRDIDHDLAGFYAWVDTELLEGGRK
jgi:hypothetical protein